MGYKGFIGIFVVVAICFEFLGNGGVEAACQQLRFVGERWSESLPCVLGSFKNNVTLPEQGKICLDLYDAHQKYKGERCSTDLDCTSTELIAQGHSNIGLWCTRDGECAPKSTEGETCSTQGVDASTFSQWCQAGYSIKLEIGNKCKPGVDGGHCNEGYCRKALEEDIEGICRPWLEIGHDCTGLKNEGCNWRDGKYCDGTRCVGQLGVGANCTSNYMCKQEDNLHCKAGKCAAKKTEGQTCDNADVCFSEDHEVMYCDGTCKIAYQGTEDASCISTTQCKDNYFCVNSRCKKNPDCETDGDCGTGGYKCYCKIGSTTEGTCGYQPTARCGDYERKASEGLSNCDQEQRTKSCDGKTGGYGLRYKYQCVESGLTSVYSGKRLGKFAGFNSAPSVNMNSLTMWWTAGLLSTFVLLL